MTSSDVPPHDIVLSVSELSFAIKSHLEPPFRNIAVRGEVTNLKFQSSGHIYFSLADKQSLLQAVMFCSFVTPTERNLKEGDTIIAQGELSVYTPRGSYQLVIRKIQHEGLGALLLKLEELKKKLKELGYFRPERKKAIPRECKRIGVITSPTGAVIKDIISVLDRRTNKSYQLILFPVRVQGDTASIEISRAIRLMNLYQMADVLIVCRGGGSQDDLSAFNSEEVANACFESSLPLISAVGHETDTTIIDLVADLRAPTPSAAAELVSEHFNSILEKCQLLNAHALTSLQQFIKKKKSDILEKARELRQAYSAPLRLIEFHSQRLDDTKTALEEKMQNLIEKRKVQLSSRMKIVQSKNPVLQIQHTLKRLDYSRSQLEKIITATLSKSHRSTSDIASALSQTARSIYKRKKNEFIERNFEQRNTRAITQYLTHNSTRLELVKNSLKALNPSLPLEKGYAIVFSNMNDTKKVIRSKDEVKLDDTVTITFKNGTVKATITGTE